MQKSVNNTVLRGIGILLVGGFVVWSWWFGWFTVLFYILGLYGAVYVVSYIFKTTAIINFLLFVGGFILYAIITLGTLYLLYIILRIMFGENFWNGLILLIILGVVGPFLRFVPMALGLVLSYPLVFMSQDIETRFYSNTRNDDPEEFS